MKTHILLCSAASAAIMVREGIISATAQATMFTPAMGTTMDTLMSALATIGEFAGKEHVDFALEYDKDYLIFTADDTLQVGVAQIGKYTGNDNFAELAGKILGASDMFKGVCADTVEKLTKEVYLIAIAGTNLPEVLAIGAAKEMRGHVIHGFDDFGPIELAQMLKGLGYEGRTSLVGEGIVSGVRIYFAGLAVTNDHTLADGWVEHARKSGYQIEKHQIGGVTDDELMVALQKYFIVEDEIRVATNDGKVFDLNTANWFSDVKTKAQAIDKMFGQHRQQPAYAYGS